MNQLRTRVSVINGPNLNLLGTREPDTYGTETLADLEARVATWAQNMGIEVSLFQSNDEGALVEEIHAASDHDGIVINPGAFTHTSRAIADAIASVEAPAIEVHISNVMARDPWRARSVLDGIAERTIFGRGAVGYRDALRLLINLQVPSTTIRYGPHPENVGDLRVPDHLIGLVVLLHGGFWLREYGRDTMDSLAADLVDHDFASWNIEYRRSGAGGAWPGSGHDVKSALDFIPQIDEVSDTPVAVIGHSAGGYLALWLSTRADLALAVGLAPITDLESAAAEGPGQEAATDILSRGAPTITIGQRSDIFLLHGGHDQLVPVKHSTRLEAAARAMGCGRTHLRLQRGRVTPSDRGTRKRAWAGGRGKVTQAEVPPSSETK